MIDKKYFASIDIRAGIKDNEHTSSAEISASSITLEGNKISLKGPTNISEGRCYIDATSNYAAIHYAVSKKQFTRVRFGIGTINTQFESFSVEVYDSPFFDDESGYKARLDLWTDANKPHLRISGPNGANPVDLA